MIVNALFGIRPCDWGQAWQTRQVGQGRQAGKAGRQARQAGRQAKI